MLVSEILHTLSDRLEWMVLFNLTTIQTLASPAVVRAMYHLPLEIDLSGYSHVVLTSAGRFLARSEQPELVEVISGHPVKRDQIGPSLFDRFAKSLSLFAIDAADCLGLGESVPYPPVLLHITLQEGMGKAQAILMQEPSRQHYELLQAVGVKFLGGTDHGDFYVAQFQNRLPVHIHAGILSHFSRTAHCNLFFLQHGTIDPRLETGLLSAAEARIQWARTRSFQALAALGHAACQRSLAMTCQPPPPQQPFPYGDLVPLGFVLQGLNRAVDTLSQMRAMAELDPILDARRAVNQHLRCQQRDRLWAFHTDRLVTATDSALVLLGVQDPEAVEALERFADGQGGYYPQLWSNEQQPGKMLLQDGCRHWCQPDYATTCMIRALRQDAGLELKTSTQYLANGMDERSGLYFANPYLVDWMLARALRQDAAATSLQQQLLAEVLSSMNEDYSFGQYDVALSTALAILTLSALGYRGRGLRAAQLRLLDCMESDGTYPVAIPFYSTLRINPNISTTALLGLFLGNMAARPGADLPQRQMRTSHDQHHGITLYQDSDRLIATALAALALSEPCIPIQQDLPNQRASEPVHRRYCCANHCDYIAQFALPPYLAHEKPIDLRQSSTGHLAPAHVYPVDGN